MQYKINVKESVFHDLKKIPRNTRDSILKAIETRLSVYPYKFGKPLKGEFRGFYRLRVGSYSIIYEVQEDDVVVVIVKVGNRSDVYL